MVAGKKVRENAIGTKEKARMSAQERRAWNRRHLKPAKPAAGLESMPEEARAADAVRVSESGGDERGGQRTG